MVTLLEITFFEDKDERVGRACLGHFETAADAADAKEKYEADPDLELDVFETNRVIVGFENDCPFCSFEAKPSVNQA